MGDWRLPMLTGFGWRQAPSSAGLSDILSNRQNLRFRQRLGRRRPTKLRPGTSFRPDLSQKAVFSFVRLSICTLFCTSEASHREPRLIRATIVDKESRCKSGKRKAEVGDQPPYVG